MSQLDTTSSSAFDTQKLYETFNTTKAALTGKLQPWSVFFADFERPASAKELPARIASNVKRFVSNYAVVVLLLSLYCILSSPALIFGVAVLGVAWWFSASMAPIQLGPLTVGFRERAIVLALVTGVLFFYLSVGATIFWLVGASIVGRSDVEMTAATLFFC